MGREDAFSEGERLLEIPCDRRFEGSYMMLLALGATGGQCPGCSRGRDRNRDNRLYVSMAQ
jgi:hypothetical protein